VLFLFFCALTDELAGRRHHRLSAKILCRSDPSGSSPLSSRCLQGSSTRIVAVHSSSLYAASYLPLPHGVCRLYGSISIHSPPSRARDGLRSTGSDLRSRFAA
jgi:hypothetical protein